jgi:hypothetical protein
MSMHAHTCFYFSLSASTQFQIEVDPKDDGTLKQKGSHMQDYFPQYLSHGKYGFVTSPSTPTLARYQQRSERS